MEFHFVYVLLSQVDASTYIGSTADLSARLKEHNGGKTKSIQHKIPFELVYYEAYKTKKQALIREKLLKSNSFRKRQLYDRIFGQE